MRFPIREYHEDHFHLKSTEAPDELSDKIAVILAHGYNFGYEDMELIAIVFVEREGSDVAIEGFNDGAEWEATLARLVDKAYDIAVHDTHIELGLAPDHHTVPASDAELLIPFTPFDTEGATNED